jgi:outer membrane protein assembly factor BamD (BamD/ComL family)
MGAVPNPSLDAGLDALQQANYSDAIAYLEAVRETELDDSLVTQASQALVTAYQRSGDVEVRSPFAKTLLIILNPTSAHGQQVPWRT